MRKKFRWLEKVYWNENVVWSPGYFVSTVGLDEEQINFIEIGPGNVLKGLVRKINSKLKGQNISRPEDIEKLEI